MIKIGKTLSVLVALVSLYGLLSAQLPQREVWITRDDSPQEIARFRVETAETPETWKRDLMDRPVLAPDAGMLFIFPEAASRSFWMLHTLIPLDMLFVDSTGRIVNLYENTTPCQPPRRCPAYKATAPAKYVLEITGGRAHALGIRVGDRLHF
jgi:hypothetical protein